MYSLPNGMTKVPWGFKAADDNGHLMPTEASAPRFARAEMGEAAIALLERLDVSLDWQRRLTAVWSAGGDLLVTLQGLQAGRIEGIPEWLGLNPGAAKEAE